MFGDIGKTHAVAPPEDDGLIVGDPLTVRQRRLVLASLVGFGDTHSPRPAAGVPRCVLLWRHRLRGRDSWSGMDLGGPCTPRPPARAGNGEDGPGRGDLLGPRSHQ